MIVQTEALEVTRYTAQYELLRTQVIGTARDLALGCEARRPRGIGLALLLREGMPGWLRAVEAVMRASFTPRATECRDCGVPMALDGLTPNSAAPLPSAQRHDITILLASLVLSTRHLAGLSPSEGGYRPCQ